MRTRFAPWIAALLGALLAGVRMTSFDLPLMIASGDRLLTTGEIPHTNPFHWPNPGFAWLDDKWGFGLLCSGANRVAGGAGLTLLNVVLGAAAGLLLYAVARRRSGAWYASGLAVVGVSVLSYRSMLRAEWISYLGVAWTLLHLDGVVAGDRRRIALVLAAMPIWAACHVYWFLGPVVIVAASIAAPIAAWSWKGAVTGLAAAAAAALSPYGVANVLHPFRILTQQGSTGLSDAIVELRVPFVSGGPFTFFHLLAAIAAAQVLVWTVTSWRGGRRGNAVVSFVLAAVALRYDRNLAFIGVAYVFAAPTAPEGSEERTASWQGWIAVPLVVGHLAGAAWFAPERRAGFGWDERAFPFDLVAAEPVAGKRFANDLSIGSFLDWKAGASFVDGNTHGYPDDHFALYRKALEGSITVHDVDRAFANDGWFLRTSAPHTRVLVVGLLLEGDYAPVAHDAVATLFRPVDDPERADALWKAWLRDVYLPVGRTWFASPDAALASVPGGAAPAKDDTLTWRRLVAASPLHRPFLDGLRAAYDARGETVQAARVWRLARRLD
ncbi:MAG: hypothetical protein K8T90_02820 [Planctomycetes bacterium]|nr:hypothetical protein [Planctomycetota bacterium]